MFTPSFPLATISSPAGIKPASAVFLALVQGSDILSLISSLNLLEGSGDIGDLLGPITLMDV